MILYHGTSAENLENILKEGLQPRKITGKTVYEKKELSHPDFVYLTRTFPVAYAYSIPDVKKIAILRIEVDEKDFYPDEDYVERHSLYVQGNKLVLTSINPKDHKDLWEKSLELMHSVCVERVLPDQIKGHIVLNTEDHDLHCGLGAEGNQHQRNDGVLVEEVPPQYEKRLRMLFRFGWGKVKKDIMKESPSKVLRSGIQGTITLKNGIIHKVLLRPGNLDLQCFVCDSWARGRPIIDDRFKHFFQVPVSAVKKYKDG